MITSALNKLEMSKSDVTAIAGWLAELLISQQYAKLSEGGHVQHSIPLKSLFIDLPATDDPRDSDTRLNIVDALEKAAFVKSKDLTLSQQFAPSSLSDNKGAFYQGHSKLHPDGSLSAVLLIGGPGQGKSTVGQLLCQLHRANLLRGHRSLSKAQKEIADDYAKRKDGDVYITSRMTATLPIQINLPEFAGWLSKNAKEKAEIGHSSAVRFLCQTPSAQEHQLKPLTLLSASKGLNVQLVFDGFDEVGSQAERLRLVAECRNFILELSDFSAHVRVLVTTRPQGYTEEFEKIGFKLTKLYLLPLKVEEALVYAHRLIKAKIHSANDRSRAQAQINTAVDEPATKRLFTTPLQITIITALVQQMGNAPRERWNLFAGYFDYAYKREVERQTFASALLRDQRQNIEQMHARVGLILQLRSELDGGASSRMTRPELEAIIDDILEAEEIPKDKKTQLIENIATAAEDRLVFLTQPEPENYGFEVRSLQEFFAAWALTNGAQNYVEARLNCISRASAFKNVYLFAASRIFGSIQSYRESWITHVCKWYDNPTKDAFGAAVKAGSIIALETLEEGVAYNQPKYSKVLMAVASGVLNLPAGKEHIRLAHSCTADNESHLQEALITALQSVERSQRLSAWTVLIECINQKFDWAEDWADRYFKIGDWDLIHRASIIGKAHLNKWLANKIEDNFSDIDPSHVFYFRSTDAQSWVGNLLSVDLLGRDRDWWKSPIFIGPDLDKAMQAPIAYTGNGRWEMGYFNCAR